MKHKIQILYVCVYAYTVSIAKDGHNLCLMRSWNSFICYFLFHFKISGEKPTSNSFF